MNDQEKQLANSCKQSDLLAPPFKPLRVTERQLYAGDDQFLGHCIRCGHKQGGCEPDAERYTCESCGQPTVYSYAECALRGWVQPVSSRKRSTQAKEKTLRAELNKQPLKIETDESATDDETLGDQLAGDRFDGLG